MPPFYVRPFEYPPLYKNYMRRSHIELLLLSPRIYTSFQQLYATLLEFTPPFHKYSYFPQLYAKLYKNYMRRSQNIFLSLSIICTSFNNYNYATLAESSPPFQMGGGGEGSSLITSQHGKSDRFFEKSVFFFCL